MLGILRKKIDYVSTLADQLDVDSSRLRSNHLWRRVAQNIRDGYTPQFFFRNCQVQIVYIDQEGGVVDLHPNKAPDLRYSQPYLQGVIPY